MKKKLAILTSHPIQYQIPLFRVLAAENSISLKVFFGWDFGVKKQFDREFNKEIVWDTPLLEGYNYSFLKNYAPSPSSDFFGQMNFGIVRELFRERYDAILVFGWNSFANWLVFLFSCFTRTKVLMRAESPLNQELLKSSGKRFFKKLILVPLFKIISGFLYIGEENKKFYKYYGVPEKKLFFAPYAVDNDYFIKQADTLRSQREYLRKKNNIAEEAFVILFTGKLIEKKRPFDLLHAYQMVLEDPALQKKKISLLFVGDGPLREELEKYVAQKNMANVVFAGFKNQTELPEYYAIADAFVLPSGLGETWGLVVNEAMCFGLPVIISDRVGCGPDLVRENESGFVVPFGDVQKIAEKIIFIIKNKDVTFHPRTIIEKYSFIEDKNGFKNFFATL